MTSSPYHHRFQMSEFYATRLSHDTRAIFSYGDLIQPMVTLTLLGMSPLLIYCAFAIRSGSLRRSLALQLALVAADKAKGVSFDLTLTRHLSLSRKFQTVLESPHREHSITASLRPLARKLAGGGGEIRPPAKVRCREMQRRDG